MVFMPDFDVEDVDPTTKKVTIRVDGASVQHFYKQACQKLQQKVSLPGFRPGKIPQALFLQTFGHLVQRDAQQALLEATLYKSIDAANLQLVRAPTVQIELSLKELQSAATLTYSAFAEVYPNIVLQQVKGLPLPPRDAPAPITEAQLNTILAAWQQDAAVLQPVAGRNAVRALDHLQVELTLQHADIPPDTAPEIALLDLRHMLLPIVPPAAQPAGPADLLQALWGHEVGDSVTVQLQVPAHASNFALRQQTVQLHIKLLALKQRSLPALDDEFARDMGADSLLALTTTLRANLEKNAQAQFRRQRLEDAQQALIAANPIMLPATILEQQVDAMLKGAQQRLTQENGTAPDANTLEELRRNILPSADNLLRGAFLYQAVARQEDIAVSAAEVEAYHQQLLHNLPAAEVARLQRQWRQDTYRLNLEEYLLEAKVTQFLEAHAATPQEAASRADPEPLVSAKAAVTP